MLAGDDYETAYVPASAREILTRFQAKAKHFEMAVIDPMNDLRNANSTAM